MDWDGNGNIDRDFFPEEDRDNGIKVLASKFEDLFASQVTLIENCYTLDSQTTPTQDLAMGNNKITGLTDGTVGADAVNFSQIEDKLDSVVGGTNITIDDTDPNNPIINGAEQGYNKDYINGGIIENDSVTPDELINISSLIARSSDNTEDIQVDALEDFDITEDTSWASGTAPTLTSITVYVFAVYDNTTPYFIFDVDEIGTNITPAKRLIGSFLTDSSGDIVPIEKDLGEGNIIRYRFVDEISYSGSGSSGSIVLDVPADAINATIKFTLIENSTAAVNLYITDNIGDRSVCRVMAQGSAFNRSDSNTITVNIKDSKTITWSVPEAPVTGVNAYLQSYTFERN